ncbi:DUF882 domain-containing protein [Rhizobium leguminosarum]|uniref:DUF882 domain-containing protein n=1 Tax=Rhizobium leguminosarum TaxID=384 RepID=UPI0014417BE6|nr:DUF882 domain-containing protein [Rhizobium leguminosarum]NKL66369.1 DUF882 domain-containing protein [Rhizobium leguminosarum bv. viciae]
MPNLNGNSKPSRLSWRLLCADICGKAIRTVAAALLALAVSSPVFVGTPSQAAGDTRSLKLYFIHTGEKAVITYKRNGKFDPKGLEQLNRFLRDWRKNQPTKMDPRLFDLIWEVYRQSGSRDYINVVCGFRSPGTNEMLRGRSRNSGVAEKSQHMLGKAMDFFIPDVKLATLRGIGMKMQVGGVGFYPKSGSPFGHMDVGGVRAWPRMSRDELVRLFPNGNTIHIPADGKPLPGYQQAMADYKRRASGTQIQIASASESEAPKHKTLFAALFGGGADEQEDESDDSTPVAIAKATPPKAEPAPAEPALAEPKQTEVADLNAPVPQVRPAFSNQPAGSEVASALVAPPSGNPAQQALAAALPADQAQPQQFADLSAYSIPVPSLLGQRRAPGDAEVASTDPVLTGANGLPVPTPIERPSVAENLLAAADADPEAEADEADQDALSPAVADALDQQRNEGESQIASKAPPVTVEQAINAAMTQKTPAAKPPLELAALAPMTKSASFGDSFDEPAAESAVAQGLPAKGGRPTQKEAAAADASRTTVRTEPKLTEKMISQWALTNARLEMASKQVKAPRFVSQTMRAQPTAVYAEGFNIKTASVDPARFSGTAVNFMEVRKFNTN